MGIKYRPEIDGLRAIAVLAVVLFHAEFQTRGLNPFRGGFIGVDVFFVISGYLITSIILKGLQSGGFSFADFYERRARRILPVLFTVLMASIPLAWRYLLPKAMKEYAASVITSLLFSSNFWFWSQDSYWAEPSAQKPFLHTWSLAVEEQFYLIFPVLLIFLWKYARRRLTGAFLLLGLLSLLFAQIQTPNAPEFTFFLLPARFWELLAGALLAGLESGRGRKSSPFFAKTAPAAGLGLILFSLAYFDESTPHPSLLTLIPVAGVMLIIWFAQKGEPVTGLLSGKWLVRIGLISYGLYMWHYPVFAFSRIAGEWTSPAGRLACIALALGLSVFSYFTIERPFRNRAKVGTKSLTAALAASFSLVLAVSTFAYVTDGTADRFTAGQLKFLDLDRKYGGDFSRYVVDCYYGKVALTRFAAGGPPRLLLIGDSFSQDFANVLEESGRAGQVQLAGIYIGVRCLNVPASTPGLLDRLDDGARNACKDAKRVGDPEVDEIIAQTDGVIVASGWDEYTMLHVNRLVEEIRRLGVPNVLVVGRKQFPTLTTARLLDTGLEELTAMRLEVDGNKYSVSRRMKDDLAAGYLDMHGLVCGPSPLCPVATPDGFLISFDGVHLTQEGARYIGSRLGGDRTFGDFWNALAQTARQRGAGPVSIAAEGPGPRAGRSP